MSMSLFGLQRGARARAVALCIVLAGLGGSACKAPESDTSALKKPKGINKLEYPVQVAPLELRQVAYNVTAPGSIEAFQQVQITARVAGAVDRVSFVEGQQVKQGDVLVTIETDRYQVAVDQAKAALSKTMAAHKAAEAELARRQGAVAAHPGLVAGEEIEQYATSVTSTQADSDAAQQAVRVAQLNLRDATVRAPFAGVIQTRTVQGGQYLQPGAILGTLLQRDPLLLKFQLTEADAPRISPGMMVTLALRETKRTYQAKVTLVAGSADPTSHLVPVTAQIDDTEHKYWLRPGVFCDVSIPVGAKRKAAVIPELAIRASERGFLAYVVQDNIAKERVVELGMHTGDGFVEVTQGLSAGEILVVHGADPLSDGSPVKIAARTTLEAFDAGGAPPVAQPTPSAAAASPLAAGPRDAGAHP